MIKLAAMERERFIPDLDRINWPNHVTSEQLTKMARLCLVKNTRVVVADEIETEGLVIRGAVEQKFRTPEHPQWQMAHGYASIGQAVRQVDDSLGIWCRESGMESSVVNSVNKRHLYSLIHDPGGLELLDMVVLEKSSDPKVSLPEALGLVAGARRYYQLYEALTKVGVKPKELDERFYPPIAGGAGGARPLLHRDREKPIPKEGEYKVVEEIIPGVVLIDEQGSYHVFWGGSHYYVQDGIQGVLNNHDRVIENLQGTMIAIKNETVEFLEIAGEIPQAMRFSARLSMISAGLRNTSLQTPQTRRQLLGELGQLRDEIGQVRNELKRRGKDEITIALSVSEPKVAGEKAREAAKDFLERATEAATKLEGAIKREERILQKRNKWEGVIEDSFRILGNYLLGLEERGKPTPRWLQSMTLQIALSRKNILSDLQAISGQPYKRRMEQPEIKRLGQLPDAVAQGDFLMTKRILREAILMLERVVKEKAERERNKDFPG